MSDPNPIIRSRALEHFRKTVGLETGGGVSVNVHQQAVIQNTNPRSFEEAMDRVRLQHAKAEQERTAIESGSPKKGRLARRLKKSVPKLRDKNETPGGIFEMV